MEGAFPRRFAVLDRDGTLIEGVPPYVLHPDHVALLPGVAEGLRNLRSLGLGLIVVTNQPAVGRGLIDAARLKEINRRLTGLLASHGVGLDGIYVCTHHPDEECVCRKPKPGLIERAAGEFNFDPQRAFVIGDDIKDIELGRAVGATTFLVRTGHGESFVRAGHAARAHYVVADLPAAAVTIGKIVAGESV